MPYTCLLNNWQLWYLCQLHAAHFLFRSDHLFIRPCRPSWMCQGQKSLKISNNLIFSSVQKFSSVGKTFNSKVASVVNVVVNSKEKWSQPSPHCCYSKACLFWEIKLAKRPIFVLLVFLSLITYMYIQAS